jgi:hypothetical protein
VHVALLSSWTQTFDPIALQPATAFIIKLQMVLSLHGHHAWQLGSHPPARLLSDNTDGGHRTVKCAKGDATVGLGLWSLTKNGCLVALRAAGGRRLMLVAAMGAGARSLIL